MFKSLFLSVLLTACVGTSSCSLDHNETPVTTPLHKVKRANVNYTTDFEPNVTYKLNADYLIADFQSENNPCKLYGEGYYCDLSFDGYVDGYYDLSNQYIELGLDAERIELYYIDMGIYTELTFYCGDGQHYTLAYTGDYPTRNTFDEVAVHISNVKFYSYVGATITGQSAVGFYSLFTKVSSSQQSAFLTKLTSKYYNFTPNTFIQNASFKNSMPLNCYLGYQILGVGHMKLGNLDRDFNNFNIYFVRTASTTYQFKIQIGSYTSSSFICNSANVLQIETTTQLSIVYQNNSYQYCDTTLRVQNYLTSNDVNYLGNSFQARVVESDYTLNDLMLAIVDSPLFTLYSLLNFNVLGVNIFALMTGLVTLLIVVFVVKHIVGH